MSNDEKPLGLVLPSDIQSQKGKVNVAEEDIPIIPAKPLVFDQNGKMASIHNLLEQIRDGSQEFLERNSHLGNTLLRNEAILCSGMAAGFLQAQEDYENGEIQEAPSYGTYENSLIMGGYFYRDLTSLSPQDNEKMVNAMLKRQAGPISIENKREHGREWLRERAIEIWSCDHNQEKRIGEVAEELIALARAEQDRRKMERDESAKHWPLSPGKVKKAIRPVAPEYASRKGRPPNN